VSIIGSTIAETDRYDWGLMLGSAALALVALLLQVPLWAVAIVAFVGPAAAGVRGACHDLGLVGHRDVDEQGAMSASEDVDAKTGAQSNDVRPATLSPQPPAANRP
jgi:hypothetical protein